MTIHTKKYDHLSTKELEELIKMIKREGPKIMLKDLMLEEKRRKSNFLTRLFI